MIRSHVSIAVISAALCGAALANIPDLDNSFAEMGAAAAGASVLVVPDGSGARFDEARAPGGEVVDATITLTLLDWYGSPIQGFPPEDIWLETTAGGLVPCTYGITPDAPTDVNGQTIWLEPAPAGDCSVGESTVVVVAGSPLLSPPLDLFFVSPDLSGDLEINLADIAMFAQAIFEYQPCADFNHDWVVNLVDVVMFTQALGAICE